MEYREETPTLSSPNYFSYEDTKISKRWDSFARCDQL